MARLMLRGPKKLAAPKKMMSPTTIVKSMAPIPMNKPISPAAPKSSVPTLTQRLQSMAASIPKREIPKPIKDLKPEPISPIMLDKPKRKVPAKRSAAIRKVKKPVVQKKK
jgi:hypothetical protein